MGAPHERPGQILRILNDRGHDQPGVAVGLDRAMEVFNTLEMEKTEHRNGVIIYIAVKDQQLAVFGDEGIHQKLGIDFWQTEVGKMLKAFNSENFAEGIIHIIGEIGNALYIHFPYNRSDKNELPDDIVFGR